MKRNTGKQLLIIAALAALAVSGVFANTNSPNPATDEQIAKQMVHEIRMYPRYSIWDDIKVKVQGGNIELDGAVSQPYKKTDLGRIAQRVPGVTGVANDLKVLPLSPFDDRLRMQVARAIFRDPTLSRYSMGAQPSIHIIVDNGHVTLEGVVMNQMDKNIAGMRANAAGLSFGEVTNNLVVENSKSHS